MSENFQSNLKNEPDIHTLPIALRSYLLLIVLACLWPFNFWEENNVAWEPAGGLRFSSPATAYTDLVVEAMRGMKEFTLVAHFESENPGETSWILSHGLDFERASILVGLNLNQLVVRAARGGRFLQAGIQGALRQGVPVWLAVVVDSTGMTVYLNGNEKRHVRSSTVGAVTSAEEYPLILGSRSDGKFPWEGVFYTLAVFDRRCGAGELRNPSLLISSGNPVVYYDFTTSGRERVRNSGTGKAAAIRIPRDFEPLQRGLLMGLGNYWIPAGFWADVVLNIAVFVPIGLLIGTVYRERMNTIPLVLFILAVSLLLSFGIEVLQSYLPRRWSSIWDVASNTAGGLLGAWLSQFPIVYLGLRRLSAVRLQRTADLPEEG